MTSIPWGEIKPKNQFQTKPGGPKSGVMGISMYKQTWHMLVHTPVDLSFNAGGLVVIVLREIVNCEESGLSVKVTKRR